MSTPVEVKEEVRRIVSTHGHEIRLKNVTSVDNTGSWIRFDCDQGYVIVNPNNVLAFIIKGAKVF